MKAQTHYKLDASGETCVVYIRKNACSLLKAMIVEGATEAPRGMPAIKVMGQFRACDVRDVVRASKSAFILGIVAERRSEA